MFRAVFPSVIRSSRLYIQQQAYIKQNYSQIFGFGSGNFSTRCSSSVVIPNQISAEHSWEL